MLLIWNFLALKKYSNIISNKRKNFWKYMLLFIMLNIYYWRLHSVFASTFLPTYFQRLRVYSWRACIPHSNSNITQFLACPWLCDQNWVFMQKICPPRICTRTPSYYFAINALLREEGDDELAKRFVKMPVNLKMIICKVMVNINW